jgi:hypothetical protein
MLMKRIRLIETEVLIFEIRFLSSAKRVGCLGLSYWVGGVTRSEYMSSQFFGSSTELSCFAELFLSDNRLLRLFLKKFNAKASFH